MNLQIHQGFKTSRVQYRYFVLFCTFFSVNIFPGGCLFFQPLIFRGNSFWLGCCCWKTNQPPGAVLEQSFQSREVDPPSRVGLGWVRSKSFVFGKFFEPKKITTPENWSREKPKKEHPQSLTWNLKNDDFQKESPFPGADFQLLNCRGVHQFDQTIKFFLHEDFGQKKKKKQHGYFM